MALHLTIAFPSEARALREQMQSNQGTPTQRLQAVVDALAATEAISHAGAVRPAQLQYHAHQEEEWQRRMKEFITKHVST